MPARSLCRTALTGLTAPVDDQDRSWVILHSNSNKHLKVNLLKRVSFPFLIKLAPLSSNAESLGKDTLPPRSINPSVLQQNLTQLIKFSRSANCYTAHCSFQLIIYPSPCPAENKPLLRVPEDKSNKMESELRWTLIYTNMHGGPKNKHNGYGSQTEIKNSHDCKCSKKSDQRIN